MQKKGRDEARDLQALRRRVSFDRFLHRIFQKSFPNKILLKGGYAMELRLPIARTTKDIDLSILDAKLFSQPKNVQEDALFDLLIAASRINLSDFFEFEVSRTKTPVDAVYGGARFTIKSLIGGKEFVNFHVDVAIGDVLIEPNEITKPEQLLSFAGIVTPDYPIVSREQHLAEKLHIYTRTDLYDNSRVKDLVDMVLLIKNGVELPKLVLAVQKTFERRQTHNLPSELKEPHENWQGPFKKLAEQCRLNMTIEEAFTYVNSFFMDHIAGTTGN